MRTHRWLIGMRPDVNRRKLQGFFMNKPFTGIALAVLLLIALFATTPTLAQRSLAGTLYASGLKAYQEGNYREALRIFRECNEMAKTTPHTPAEEEQLVYSLGETLRAMGMYQEAETTLKTALEISEKLPLKQRNTFWIFNDLAGLYQIQGRYEEAEGLWKQCEIMGKKDPSKEFYPVDNLAHHYFLWGKLKEEAEYCEKGGRLAKLAPKTIALPYWQCNLAQYAQQKGLYKEAEQAYKLSLASCEEAVGPTHPYCGMVQRGLADLYRKQSRYSDAEKCLQAAQKIFEARYSNEHPDILETKVGLAKLLSDEGKYVQARELVTAALKTEETVFGTGNNLFVCRSRDCLGNIYRQDGRYQEAQEKITQAFETEKKILGKDNVEVAVTMRDLALVEADQANYKEAESLLQASLSTIEQQTGPDHPERAAAANALAHVYLRDEKYSDALPLFKKALELSEKVLGPDNPVTAGSARDLGELCLKEKQFAEAQGYLQKSLAIDEKLYGENAPQVAASLMALATAYGAGGASDKAEPLLKRAAAIKNVLPGGNASAAEVPQAGTSGASDRPVTGKWALVVGISNFKDSSINLRYAAKDATDFKNFLVNTEKFRADHVKLLTDEDATRENIIGMLGDKWLSKRVRPDDLVVLYVSSHGSSASNEAGGTNFMVAYDTNKNSLPATGIPMQWLANIVSEQVHSAKVRLIMLLDVCHSGAVDPGQKDLIKVSGADPRAMKIGEGQMIICSSQSDQVSWESKHYENSVFTRRLIEALQSNKDQTTMLDAYKQLKVLVESEVLKDRGNLQTPLFLNKRWMGKDPVLSIEPTGK
jgi:tetratricopeptide (TPR) repeat protein